MQIYYKLILLSILMVNIRISKNNLFILYIFLILGRITPLIILKINKGIIIH